MKKIMALCLFTTLICFLVSCISNGKKETADDKLYEALLAENLEAVKEAVEEGADIERIHASVSTPLQENDHNPTAIALQFDQPDIVSFLVKRGVNVNYTGNTGVNLLMGAAMGQQIPICKMLLNKGADVTVKTPDNETYFGRNALDFLLMQYTSHSSSDVFELMQEFLDKGAQITPSSVRACVSAGYSSSNYRILALHQLFLQNESKREAYRLDDVWCSVLAGRFKEVAANSLSVEMLNQILFFAAAYGTTTDIECLVSMGADINTYLESGDTPLHVAAELNSRSVVQYFIEHGLKPDVKNNEGISACSVSVCNSDKTVFPYLYAFYSVIDENLLANIGFTDNVEAFNVILTKQGLRDSDLAVIADGALEENRKEILSKIISVDFPINEVDLLQTACQKKNISSEIISLLLENEANVNSIAEKGTPLYYAVSNKRFDLVQILVKNGADINTHIYHINEVVQSPPLHIAIRMGNIEIIEYFMENGADINYADLQTGNTPILEAASGLSSEVFKKVLTYNPDFTIKNKEGLSVKKIISGNTEFQELFQEYTKKKS